MGLDLRSAAAHAFAWGGALAVDLLVARPMLRSLALDFETIVVNQYEQQNLPLEVLPWGRAAIQYGGTPLLLLLVASALYALAGHDGPVRRRPRWVKAGVAAVVALPFAAFVVPFSLALSIWVAVEAFWWVEWHGHADATVSGLIALVPTLLVPSGSIAAAAGLALALRVPPEIRPRRRKLVVWLVRRPLAVLGIVATVVAGAVLLAAAPRAVRVVGSPGPELFEERCGDCHFRVSALHFARTPAEWERNVDRMLDYPGFLPSSEAEQQQMTDFLVGLRGFSDAWTFRTRCGRCHGSTARGWQDRRPEDWSGMVDRLARWSPGYHRADVRAQLLSHLDRHHTDPDATLGLEPERYERLFALERACAVCHTIGWDAERWREQPRDAVRRMIVDMGDKRPDTWTEAEVDELTDAWIEVIADPALLDRVFPHDRPMTDEVLVW